MKTILDSYESLLEIERSSFYSFLFPIEDENHAKRIIEEIRKKHPKARHCCYAYKVGPFQKSSDDGEPKGTAGRPLMDVLLKNELDNTLLIVVRYFGGIKLGAGRLLRTYVDSAMLSINKARIYTVCEAYSYKLTLSHSHYDLLLRHLLKNEVDIDDTSFEEKIIMEVSSLIDIEELINSLFHSQIKIERLEKKIKYR